MQKNTIKYWSNKFLDAIIFICIFLNENFYKSMIPKKRKRDLTAKFSMHLHMRISAFLALISAAQSTKTLGRWKTILSFWNNFLRTKTDSLIIIGKLPSTVLYIIRSWLLYCINNKNLFGIIVFSLIK